MSVHRPRGLPAPAVRYLAFVGPVALGEVNPVTGSALGFVPRTKRQRGTLASVYRRMGPRGRDLPSLARLLAGAVPVPEVRPGQVVGTGAVQGVLYRELPGVEVATGRPVTLVLTDLTRPSLGTTRSVFVVRVRVRVEGPPPATVFRGDDSDTGSDVDTP